MRSRLAPMLDPRPTCYDCFRPTPLCICGVLRPVDNRTRVTIVQHPRERLHPLNTARIAEGSLRNVRVLRGDLTSLAAQVGRGVIPPDALLLYPGPDSIALEELPAGERPREIVILDGTWHHASTLLRDLPALAQLRCARFTPPAPSEYQIRREPQVDYLSTVESIAHVLSLLEPETVGIEGLRESFRTMVARNISARRHENAQRARSKRRRAYVLPEELQLPPQRLALVYAEGAQWGAATTERQPLVIAVLLPDTGETWQILLRPRGPVRARLLEELRISQEQIETQGLMPTAAKELLVAALTDRVVASWNASTFSILGDLGVPMASRLFLKATYCDYRRSLGDRPAAWGGMSTILQTRGIACVSSGGRADRRLAQTYALCRHLQEVAQTGSQRGEISGTSTQQPAASTLASSSGYRPPSKGEEGPAI